MPAAETVAQRIALPGDPSALTLLAPALDAFARRAGLPDAARHDLDLLLEELVTNTVAHGYAGTAGPIGIHVRCTDGRVRICWCDQAAPFDPLSAALPPAPPSLAEARLGGAGIALVRRLVQGGSYRRTRGRNVLIFHLRRR